MTTRNETQKLAEAAASVLDNPVMRHARQAVRDKVYNSWVACPDPQERDKLHSIAVANEELWTVLRRYIDTGDVELSNVLKMKGAPP